MIIPGDEGPMAAEDGLFQMSQLHSTDQLNKVIDDNEAQDVAEDSEDSDAEEGKKYPKHTKYDREKGTLDSEGLWYDEHDQSAQDKTESDEETDNEEELGLEWEEDDTDDEDDAKIKKQNENSKNPLLLSLSADDPEERKARRAEQWFSKIGDLDEDSDLEEAELQRAVNIVEKKGGSIKKKEKVSG